MTGWFIAGFDAPCEWGDWISPGDTVRIEEVNGEDLLEHRDCREAEGPVRPIVVSDTDCVDARGDVWPEHDFQPGLTECTRCGAEAEEP